MWSDLSTMEAVVRVTSLWLRTLETQGCAKLVATGTEGVMQVPGNTQKTKKKQLNLKKNGCFNYIHQVLNLHLAQLSIHNLELQDTLFIKH